MRTAALLTLAVSVVLSSAAIDFVVPRVCAQATGGADERFAAELAYALSS